MLNIRGMSTVENLLTNVNRFSHGPIGEVNVLQTGIIETLQDSREREISSQNATLIHRPSYHIRLSP